MGIGLHARMSTHTGRSMVIQAVRRDGIREDPARCAHVVDKSSRLSRYRTARSALRMALPRLSWLVLLHNKSLLVSIDLET